MQGSITGQFAQMDSARFEQQLDKRWEAITEVREVVQRQVSSGNLTPLDGIKAISSCTAQILGYEEFHPSQGTSPSLVEALVGNAVGQGQKGRQPSLA
jgi:hypothetical protein